MQPKSNIDQTQLLTANQMQQVDKTAAVSGVDTFGLMLNAGRAVGAHILTREYTVATALIIAGNGNNGGDGFVAAETIRKTGISTTVVRVGPNPIVGSDAEKAQNFYNGKLISVDKGAVRLPEELHHEFELCDVIVDALFGAGLNSEVRGIAAMLIDLINQTDTPVVAIDLPSGLDGNDHCVRGVAVQATSTVTFFRAKPAHLLYPGRQLCGQIMIEQIGLNQSHVPTISNPIYRNSPQLFAEHLPTFHSTSHKYQRGHVLVRSGPMHSTGAARLSATTALNCGTGVVSMASSKQALPVNASHLTAVMLAQCDCVNDWLELLLRPNVNTGIIGPGNGLDEQTQQCVLKSLEASVSLILDADALSCWQSSPERFISALQIAKSPVILTPHAAEFNRVFKNSRIDKLPSKLHQAKAAAELTKAVIIYKGADTVVAAPDGRAAINSNAPPWLATAGSGDVLAGAVAALHAQAMPVYESALAAVWLHGQAATSLGYPLTAEQLSVQMGLELHHLAKQQPWY